MAGIDLPVKLRRGLGQGKVVPAEDLAKWMAPFDADGDGQVTRPELATFFQKHKVGGPWFCEVVARTLWKFVEQRLAKEMQTIPIELASRILNTAMSRGPRPEKRYEIDPEAMAGYKPIQMLKKRGDPMTVPPSSSGPATSPPTLDSSGRPRATPRGASAETQRQQSTTPGRTNTPQVGASRPMVRRPAPRRPGPRR